MVGSPPGPIKRCEGVHAEAVACRGGRKHQRGYMEAYDITLFKGVNPEEIALPSSFNVSKLVITSPLQTRS